MSDIYDLMAEEARQSFFQLENVIASLDSKVFGVMTADTLLFSVFTYFNPPSSNVLFYIAPIMIIISFVLLLASVWPRQYPKQFSEDVIKKYGKWDSKLALAQLAANYSDLEKKTYEIYNNKFKWFYAGLISMVVAMATELVVIGFITFDP